MKFHPLERAFFDKVLNATLDIPVNASIHLADELLEVTVIPRIANNEFVLDYYNAPEYRPEPQPDEDGRLITHYSGDEAFGIHPALKQAWTNQTTLSVELHRTSIPIERFVYRAAPKLDARVLLADYRHSGRLGLNDNRITVQEHEFNRAEFSLADFPDFSVPGHSLGPLFKKGEYEDFSRELQSAVSRVEDFAEIIVKTPPRMTLQSDDGWIVTIKRDEEQVRDSVSHTGFIEKENGAEYGIDEFDDLLECLKYFLAFVAGVYRHPSSVIGYDSHGIPFWGQIGHFDIRHSRTYNWFNNRHSGPFSTYLEHLFPLYRRKWKGNRDAVVSIVTCYAHSNVMRQSGLPEDSLAKSYAGLDVLAGAMLNESRPKGRNSEGKIGQALSRTGIPFVRLEESKTPRAVRLCQNLMLNAKKGNRLLSRIRNYVTHPLNVKMKDEEERKLYRQHLDNDPGQYFYLQDLSQFYLEYMFLEFCGYTPQDYRGLMEQSH